MKALVNVLIAVVLLMGVLGFVLLIAEPVEGGWLDNWYGVIGMKVVGAGMIFGAYKILK